jgi:hypothetical protein
LDIQRYISEPNKHIEEYFDYYFEGKKQFEYAVLLNGEWGSGKTWFVKKYIEKQKKQDKKVAYISLNGISKISEIDEAIFKCIHPVLGSKQAKLTGQILKGALKATLRIDLDGDSKQDGSVNASVPDIKLPDYLKIDDNFILIFDDLERCELKIEETLGYINYFVEQEKIKVVIVSNDTEIKESDNFLRKKEKLIGATFNYTEDQNLAIRSILEEVENFELKAELISMTSFIFEIFNSIGYKNLRAFKQTIFDFERFYRKDFFEYKGKFDQDIFENILKSFLIISLENKIGRFDKKILKFKKDDGKNNDNKEIVLKIMRGIDGKDAEAFMNKYNLSLKDFILSPDIWNEIINLNIKDEVKINKELYDVYFRLKEEQPTWYKLMNFLDFEEDIFESFIRLAKQDIESSKLTNLTDIFHTISMLIYFKDNKLIFFPLEDLLSKALNQVKELLNIQEGIRSIAVDSSFREYSVNYAFYAKDIEKFEIFMDDVVKLYANKYVEKNSERVYRFMRLMESDSYEFYQLVINEYYDYPIFNFFNIEDFVNRLCQIKSEDTMRILYAMERRYEVNSPKNIYSQEMKWFEEVIRTTEKKLESAERLVKAKINLKLLPKLREIKNKAYLEQ